MIFLVFFMRGLCFGHSTSCFDDLGCMGPLLHKRSTTPSYSAMGATIHMQGQEAHAAFTYKGLVSLFTGQTYYSRHLTCGLEELREEFAIGAYSTYNIFYAFFKNYSGNYWRLA